MRTANCPVRSVPSRKRLLVLRSMLGVCVAGLALASVQTAQAALATGSMTVTATVASSCVVGASSLSFGSITSAAIQAGNIDATGTVTVNCTTGTPYTVGLGVGAGSGATFASRKMTSGAPITLLNYTIYTQTGRTTVWGDGTATSVTVPGTGSGAVQSIDAYGRILSGQTVPALTYNDTVSVTITY